jgi:hypothetical protein
MKNIEQVIERLLSSSEPSIVWKIKTGILGIDSDSAECRPLQDGIRNSVRARTLLSRLDDPAVSVYAKWQGIQWVLGSLADLGYPKNDESLLPACTRMVESWLLPGYFIDIPCDNKGKSYQKHGIPVMEGRHRRCASQQGYALLNVLRLGFRPPRTEQLVERLLYWQWPDGGWNCDRIPSANTSSFMETLIPMKGLDRWAAETGDLKAKAAADRASEVFLSRRFYKRRSDSRVIHPEFTKLHFPLYWHYDFLSGLKAFADSGRICDQRCNDALDLLESKRLPDGGWSAEAKYYTRVGSEIKLGTDFVNWGGTSRKKLNEWVTADALYVLKTAGRLG